MREESLENQGRFVFIFNFQLYVCVVEIFLIENQQSATDDRRGPCLYVDSKTDSARIKVTGCNETDERQNWAYTLKGQIMVSQFHSVSTINPGVGGDRRTF